MALTRMDYHVALTTLANFTCHVNVEESVAYPLFHCHCASRSSAACSCAPTLGPSTPFMDSYPHGLLPVTLSVNTRNSARQGGVARSCRVIQGRMRPKLAQANPHRVSGGAKLSGNVCDLPLEARRATRFADTPGRDRPQGDESRNSGSTLWRSSTKTGLELPNLCCQTAWTNPLGISKQAANSLAWSSMRVRASRCRRMP